MLTQDEQNEIMRQDRRRRYQREQREAIEQWIAEHTPSEATPAMPNLRGIGIVGSPPVSKASRDNWTTGRNARTRTVGMAPGANPADGPTYLATYADGTTAILPVPSRTRKTRVTRNTAPQAREHHMTCADLAPIGNVE